MTSTLLTLAMALPGVLRLGHVRVSVFSLFAALGLLTALFLSQRTAVRAGVTPSAAWDAGMFAVTAAFLTSRVLLVASDPHAFLRYPLLVLSLPSLTWLGIVLTAGFTAIYLRRKRLPLTPMLDTFAAPAALLAAVLSLGHWFEGTDAGMPTRLPWGVRTAGDTILGRVHPVQLYAVAAALALTEFLLIRLKYRRFPGEPAAWALLLGGLLAFGLDMLQQPVESIVPQWLDPGQYAALLAVLAGALLWVFRADVRPAQRRGRSSPLDHPPQSTLQEPI